MKKEFQRFMIHCTFELGKDQELVENERRIVQELMIENNIEFTLELSEKMLDSGDDYYSLYLIVPKELGKTVMEILDNAGGLGYEVDFNETLVVGDNTSTIIYEDEKTGYEYNESTQEELNVLNENINEDSIVESDYVVESTDGITKPKKTIVDYIIYLAIIALVIKLLSNLM